MLYHDLFNNFRGVSVRSHHPENWFPETIGILFIFNFCDYSESAIWNSALGCTSFCLKTFNCSHPIFFKKKDTTLTRAARFSAAVALKPYLLLFSTHTLSWSEGEIFVVLSAPDCCPSSWGLCESVCLGCPAQAFFTWLIFTHLLRLFIYPLLWEYFPEPIGWRNATFHCIQKAHSAQLFPACLFDFIYLFLILLALYLMISALVWNISREFMLFIFISSKSSTLSNRR